MDSFFKEICFFVCLGFMFVACNSSKIETNTGDKVSYKDSVFLQIEGDLNHPDVIWGAKDIWVKALARMECHKRVLDNQFVWNVKNGSQIKISENIYVYIIRWWERQNKKLETGKYKIERIENGRYFVSPIKDTVNS